MSANKTIAKIMLASLLATGMVGCASKQSSDSTTGEVTHEKGDRETLDDGSIKVYLDNGASFTVEKGTSDEDIENYIEMFSESLENPEVTDSVTDEAEAEATEEATDESSEAATDESSEEVQGEVVEITDDAAAAEESVGVSE